MACRSGAIELQVWSQSKLFCGTCLQWKGARNEASGGVSGHPGRKRSSLWKITCLTGLTSEEKLPKREEYVLDRAIGNGFCSKFFWRYLRDSWLVAHTCPKATWSHVLKRGVRQLKRLQELYAEPKLCRSFIVMIAYPYKLISFSTKNLTLATLDHFPFQSSWISFITTADTALTGSLTACFN